MATREDDIQAMKEIVDQAVKIPLFTYEMQLNAQRPSGEYAAVKWLSSVNPGFDECSIVTDSDGVEYFRTLGIRVLTFHIIFSRDGQEYVDYDNSYYRPDVQAVMRKHGFAAMGKEALNLATTQFETNWEVRQAIKVQFNVKREQITPVDVMENAIVGGLFYDGQTVIHMSTRNG
ncbi:tail completion [Erwinia phage Faunus]|uniref:Phage neck terminator protein gp12-like domain-containing protein n=1 Tax=Erwinia phage Faunus TaxID=2182346 RepID=A0A2U8UWQ6_9CAUD|nr:tail completion [Erwinia phage Faunus]AWN08640.1 hypothetical protein [Erwinia phage Faunus]